ncbi:MAG: hypothetical protein GX802_02255 [Clostridiales bacterium]|nr:hypothetical protein [Clostridiales bacterium]
MTEKLLKAYSSARSNLLTAVLLTVLNCVLILLNIGWTFYFSTTLPQFLVAIAITPNIMQQYMIGSFVLAAFFISALVLCYVNSKETDKLGWLIGAAVLILVDILFSTYLLLFSFEAFSFIILYLIFDVVILGLLINGIVTGSKLNKIALEQSSAFFAQANQQREVSFAEQYQLNNNVKPIGMEEPQEEPIEEPTDLPQDE